MAAVFNPYDKASPVGYDASKVALVLLDFHRFVIDMCGDGGIAATVKAKEMRDWALSEGMMVIHSLVDVNEDPAPSIKGREKIKNLVNSVSKDPKAIEEPDELAYSKIDREYVVLKQPGVVSGLRNKSAQELLVDHDIKVLILCGLSTSGAVLRTAVPATDSHFVVAVLADACWDPKKDVHEMLLTDVLPSRAHVTTVEEFKKEWTKAKLPK